MTLKQKVVTSSLLYIVIVYWKLENYATIPKLPGREYIGKWGFLGLPLLGTSFCEPGKAGEIRDNPLSSTVGDHVCIAFLVIKFCHIIYPILFHLCLAVYFLYNKSFFFSKKWRKRKPSLNQEQKQRNSPGLEEEWHKLTHQTETDLPVYECRLCLETYCQSVVCDFGWNRKRGNSLPKGYLWKLQRGLSEWKSKLDSARQLGKWIRRRGLKQRVRILR